MATAISTVTKKASVVKTTKGSEKKWSEILSMNRRHDLQLPLDIAKYDSDSKRTFNFHQRHKYQTERGWANKHETWYQDDFLFRNHLLKQLKPITRRFKRISSLSLHETPEGTRTEQQTRNDMSDAEETTPALISFTPDKKEKHTTKELPPIKQQPKRRQSIKHFQNFSSEEVHPTNPVLSKLMCPKVLHEYEPRLYSHTHAPFLDVAQRFINRHPESLEKGIDNKEKQKRQKQYFKILIQSEQERARLAAAKFQQQLQDDKTKEHTYDDFDDDNESFYTRPF